MLASSIVYAILSYDQTMYPLEFGYFSRSMGAYGGRNAVMFLLRVERSRELTSWARARFLYLPPPPIPLPSRGQISEMILPDGKSASSPPPAQPSSERDPLLPTSHPSSSGRDRASPPSSSTSDAPPPAYTPSEDEHRYTRLAVPSSWPIRQAANCFIVFVVVVAVFVLFWAAERVGPPGRGGRAPDAPESTTGKGRMTSTRPMASASARPTGGSGGGKHGGKDDEERFGKR